MAWTPTAATTIAFLVATAALLGQMWRAGPVWPLDDAYIHLDVARTLARTGLWGVTPGVAGAASSSPLWALILAAWAAASSQTLILAPLALNLTAGVALIVSWRRILGRGWLFLVPTLVTALPAIAAVGMEPVLQSFLALGFCWRAAGAVERLAPTSRRQLAELAVWSALSMAARYECGAVIAVAAILAARRGRWREAAACLLPAALVVAGFGLWWSAQGGGWLPNSLMAKIPGLRAHAGAPGASIVNNLATNLFRTQAGPLLLATAAVILAARRLGGEQKSGAGDFALMAAGATLAQLLLGLVGLLGRYETWLVGLDAVALLVLAQRQLERRPAVLNGLAAAMVLCALPRAVQLFADVPAAARSMAWQHVAPVEALGRAAPGAPVVMNDIGYAAFSGAVTPVDLVGLGDNAALAIGRGATSYPDQWRAIAALRGAHLALVSPCWTQVSYRLPPSWRLAEVWQGQHERVYGGLTLAFLADSATGAARLAAGLDARPAPEAVTVDGPASAAVASYNAAPDKATAAKALCRVDPRWRGF